MPRKLKTLMVIALLAITTSTPAQGQQAERTRELYHIFDIKTQADRQAIIRALTDGMNINVSDSQTITPLGLVDKGYPEFDGCECDEAEVGFLGLIVSGRNAPPVLEFVEQALDQVAPFVFGAVVRDGVAPVDLGRDHRLDARCLDLLADRIGIVAPIGQEGLDPVGYHAEQRSEALHIVRLSGCQHEAEREASGIASCVKLGAEAASRSAKRLGLLSPLFMPTAQ